MENKNGERTDALEFDFDAASSGGLVFETEKKQTFVFGGTASAPVTESADTPAAEAQKNERPAQKEQREQAPAEQREEFGVPETFEVNEKYNTPLRENERTRIYSTYVPRFTGVSDSYRMKDDPRPLPKKEEEKTVAEPSEPREERTKAQPAPAFKAPAAASDDAVVVNVPPVYPDQNDEESINIFKFTGDVPEESDGHDIDEESANRKALNELKARQAARKEKAEAERRAAEEEERRMREAARNVRLSPDDYDIPEPENTGFVAGGTVHPSESDYDRPHGIPSDSEKTRKLKLAEYTSSGQRESFKDKFLDSLVAIKIRIAVIAVVAVFALLFENAEIFGIDIARMLGVEYLPSAAVVIDFQFVLCTFLLIMPETVNAVKQLWRGYVLPEISLLLSFVILFAYTAITISVRSMGYPVFGLVFILGALFVAISSFLKKKTDFECFKFVSVSGEKKIIEHEETRKYARAMLALDGSIDGYRSNIARTFRTMFVSDFFGNSSRISGATRNNLIMLIASVGAACIASLVAFFTAESNASLHALSAFALVSTFAMPSVAFLSHMLPYFHAGKVAASENSAVIGESSYIDASGVDVIAFNDTEIFGGDDVNLKRFGFYGTEDNMNRSMRLVCSLFANIGGPLHVIFAKTLEKRCTPATDQVIEDDGVSGRVDGKTVCAGTAEYMHRNGIKIPEDNDRTYSGIGAESMKVMYGAENGVVFAKFYIRYSFSEEFTSLLPALREEHIVPLVYTSDPNVSNELLRTLTMGGDCMRVMKRKTVGQNTDKIYPRISAGIVTAGDKVNAIKLILLSRKYKRFSDKLEKAVAITMASGTAAVTLLSFFGITSIPTLILGAVQLAACGVLWLFSKRKFEISKK